MENFDILEALRNVTLHIPYVRFDPRAKEPVFSTEDAVCCDLYSIEEVTIQPGETKAVHTGIGMQIPKGIGGFLYARSGLACKSDLAPANKVGVIDPDYRGEIIAMLHNHGTVVRTIAAGERIAQMKFAPYFKAEFEEVLSLEDTDRGTGGFGSTGST